MIEVYRTDGASTRIVDLIRTDDPFIAEKHYFEMCRISLLEAQRPVIIEPGGADIAPARFIPYDNVHHFDREQVEERSRMIWRLPGKGWIGPTQFQAQAVLDMTGMSTTLIASRIGVTPKTVRNWRCGKSAISWPAWAVLMTWAGFRHFVNAAAA